MYAYGEPHAMTATCLNDVATFEQVNIGLGSTRDVNICEYVCMMLIYVCIYLKLCT